MSTGTVLRVRAAMKPIATIPHALRTVDIATSEAAPAHHQRSDVCAVPAAGVVAEAMVALVLANAMLEKFGGDSIAETARNLSGYLAAIPDNLATTQIALPASYASDEQKIRLTRDSVNRLSALPGVKSVGLTSRVPVSSNGNTTWIRIVGHPYDGQHNEVNEREVSSEFFQTLQGRLLRGRYFTDADDLTRPNVVIINQALAKKYFPGEDPIGKKIEIGRAHV